MSRMIIDPYRFGGGVSQFDIDIAALLPEIYYKFDADDDFTGTINDHGSENVDVASQNTVDAAVASALRSTTTQSLAMPAFTSGNWTTEAAYYEETGNDAADLLGGGTEFSQVISFNVPAADLGNTMPFFRIAQDATQQTNEIFSTMLDAAEEDFFHYDWVGGVSASSSGASKDDGVTHIAIARVGGNIRKLEIDGVEVVSTTWNHTLETRTETLKIGGTTSSGQSGIAWRSDVMALWDRFLSDVEIASLASTYISELA